MALVLAGSALLVACQPNDTAQPVEIGTALVIERAQAWPIEEDSPGWLCIFHGNHICGQEVAS